MISRYCHMFAFSAKLLYVGFVRRHGNHLQLPNVKKITPFGESKINLVVSLTLPKELTMRTSKYCRPMENGKKNSATWDFQQLNLFLFLIILLESRRKTILLMIHSRLFFCQDQFTTVVAIILYLSCASSTRYTALCLR